MFYFTGKKFTPQKFTVMAQLVAALRYQPDNRGYNWNFSLT